METRRKLAAKVFRHTASYDALIAEYMTELAGEEQPEKLTVTYELKQSLRYGETPHQQAAFYRNRSDLHFPSPTQRNCMGKNNLTTLTMRPVLCDIVKEFDRPLRLPSNI